MLLLHMKEKKKLSFFAQLLINIAVKNRQNQILLLNIANFTITPTSPLGSPRFIFSLSSRINLENIPLLFHFAENIMQRSYVQRLDPLSDTSEPNRYD